MSIASEIQTLSSNKAAIKAAIEAKNPTIPPTDNMSVWSSSIQSIQSDGGNQSASKNDVNFLDYDGTILKSYTAEQALALSEMPGLPSHSGLVAQGWNYTIQQMKSNVTATGKCDIGCMYTTDDGKTRITLTIQDPKYSNIPLSFSQTVANGVEVDWGDGSSVETCSGTIYRYITHQYYPISYPQTYTITFNVVNGTMSFYSNIMGKNSSQSATNPVAAWNGMIDSVRIGNNVTSIGQYAFYYCCSLKSITIPNSITYIDSYTFQFCYSLASITIPNSVTSIGQNAFSTCYSLASITIPNSVTSIGQNAFSTCCSLSSIIIPSSVISIGNQAFFYCYYLASITIPNSVTSIGNQIFSSCYSLISITIPNSVTSIGQNAFSGCYGLKTFDFRTFTSVPSLANVNAFGNTPTTREIIVPDNLYDNWKSSTNWNSTTNNIVGSIVKASESSLGTL